MQPTTKATIAFVAGMAAAGVAHGKDNVFESWAVTDSCESIVSELTLNENNGISSFLLISKKIGAVVTLIPHNGIPDKMRHLDKTYGTASVNGKMETVFQIVDDEKTMFAFNQHASQRMRAALASGKPLNMGGGIVIQPAGFEQANDYARKNCKGWKY